MVAIPLSCRVPFPSARLRPASPWIHLGVTVGGVPGVHVTAVVNYADRTLELLRTPAPGAAPNATPIATINLAPLIPTSAPTTPPTPPPFPYSVGIDPLTHTAVIAYANTNIGFIADINPGNAANTSECLIAGQAPPCVISSVSAQHRSVSADRSPAAHSPRLHHPWWRRRVASGRPDEEIDHCRYRERHSHFERRHHHHRCCAQHQSRESRNGFDQWRFDHEHATSTAPSLVLPSLTPTTSPIRRPP